MAYVTDPPGSTVYMVTHRDTKKYKNLKANPWVSLLVDTRDENPPQRRAKTKALTVSGIFEPLLDPGHKERITSLFLEKHPYMEAFVQHPDAQVFSIRIKSFLLLEGPTKAYFQTVD
jgi:nitroimidazol reductase NimA-like FMN-containing flavoprotein (pyridoxamine 5'-phosphate oxidase superfamily)